MVRAQGTEQSTANQKGKMTSAGEHGGLCLFCKIYPHSAKETRALELLKQITPYYRTEKAKCTAWCYLKRSSRKGALGQPKEKSPDTPSMIVGVELYTHKDALSTQLEDKNYYQWFNNVAKEEDLFAKEEELVAWYPTQGFVSRGPGAVEHEEGMMVLLAEIKCKDENARNTVLDLLGQGAAWITENEPQTLSWSAMTRPKAPNEILMFERYRDTKSMLRHMGSKDVQKILSQVGKYSTGVFVTEWEEVDKSFVEPHPNISLTGGSKL